MDKKTYNQDEAMSLKTLISLYRCQLSVRRRETPLINEAGLTMSQFAVLEVLYHKGPMRVGDVIEQILATPGNMTVVVKNLEKEGWIERRRDSADRRAFTLVLSDQGQALIEALLPRHFENIEEIFSVLSNEEKQQLRTLLKKLGQA